MKKQFSPLDAFYLSPKPVVGPKCIRALKLFSGKEKNNGKGKAINSSDKPILLKRNSIFLIIIGLSLVIGVSFIVPNSIAESPEIKQPVSVTDKPSAKYYYDQETGMYKVKVGGGGARIVVMNYYPQNLQIDVGDSVKFYNPTKVAEPHTVTFVMDNTYMPQFAEPYALSDQSSVKSLAGQINGEPLIVPLDEEQTGVLAINARGFFPYVIDSSGDPKNLGPNASYSLDGSEKYVNSGWLVPKPFLDDFPGSSETFTVTFEKSGTYPYVCILHPWMAGQIQVK